MVYLALLPLMRTPRLPVVDLTNASADLNGLVPFAERRNMVSARVPSHFKRSLPCTRVGTLIVATIYLQLIQNIHMFRSFTVLQCSHQHYVQPVASDVEVVGYL